MKVTPDRRRAEAAADDFAALPGRKATVGTVSRPWGVEFLPLSSPKSGSALRRGNTPRADCADGADGWGLTVVSTRVHT